jgi:hypothetical protein
MMSSSPEGDPSFQGLLDDQICTGEWLRMEKIKKIYLTRNFYQEEPPSILSFKIL